MDNFERPQVPDVLTESIEQLDLPFLNQPENARKMTVFNALKKFLMSTVDYLGEAGPDIRSSWY